MVMRASLALCALLSLSGPALAEGIYRWVDDDGNVHFSETPPPGPSGAEEWKRPARDRITRVPDGMNAPVHRLDRPRARDIPEPTQIEGRSESAWRSQALGFTRKLEKLEERLERQKDRSPTGFRSSLSAARYEARKEARIEALKREIEQAERALDDFEDLARQAGVPPGWLR